MACLIIVSSLVRMIARIKKYVREIFLEWEKVSKPDWKQVKANTLVVIIATLILGIYIALIDGNEDFPGNLRYYFWTRLDTFICSIDSSSLVVF